MDVRDSEGQLCQFFPPILEGRHPDQDRGVEMLAENIEQLAARPHGDGWVVSGIRDGITCAVTLDKDGSISGGFPVSGEGITTNPPA